MHTIPLFAHTRPDQIIAWQQGAAISAHQFLADAVQLAARLPAGKHMLNMCNDRYHFTVGLAAAILGEKISLLPPSHTTEMIAQIRHYASDAFCLSDDQQLKIALPITLYPGTTAALTPTFSAPQISTQQCVAVAFTSGSTGTPQPHLKTWGMLTHSARAEAQQLGLMDSHAYTLIGTVPPQHMYGLESTVLMALHSGNALCSQQPFYPTDICQAIAAVPAPRVLVSSPVHLRALIDSGLQPASLAFILSATAPLSSELARRLEKQFDTRLREVYGSTETGVIAARLPTQSATWQLFPGISLITQAQQTLVSSAQISPPLALNDIIEAMGATQFLLHGRNADLINIAGKRHSLASLNHQLTSIDGVIDGAFFMPDETHADCVTRLTAFVVAPTLDTPRLLALLRARIDAVFLPRPLLFVDKSPRNATGKLPRAALQQLLQAHRALSAT